MTPQASATFTETTTPPPSVTVSVTPLASNTPAATATGTVTDTATPTATDIGIPTATSTLTPTPTQPVADAQESFEGEAAGWKVGVDEAGGGHISRSNTHALAGTYSARAATSGSGAVAQIRETISEPANSHTWGERPGTWIWQRAYVLIPATTAQQLGQDEYLDLAGFWSQSNGLGWWLRLNAGGALSVYGYDANGTAGQFSNYGQFPLDTWVEVEIGLHSQAGPGVKRAFAVLIDGNFYGWYHQGRWEESDYNRVAIGILGTNSAAPLELFVDHWYAKSEGPFPMGTDNRSTAESQIQDYRTQSGVQWQIDWSTWQNNLTLDSQTGLYSVTDRLQSGRNLDRMADLTSGWAEIEIGWPQGTPPTSPNSYFGPMVGFRKEINREENLEVIPIGKGNGEVDLVLEAWIGSPVILAHWPMPAASIGGGSHIPESGDIIRARWEQVTQNDIRVRASYYDASTSTWHTDIIDYQFDGTQVGASQFGEVNYNDGFHSASSVTIDSPSYSIQRFQVGTLATYP